MPIRTAQDSHGTHFAQFDAHAASASAVCAVCNAMPINISSMEARCSDMSEILQE